MVGDVGKVGKYRYTGIEKKIVGQCLGGGCTDPVMVVSLDDGLGD